MRQLSAVLLVLVLTGCGTDAALTAQDAKSGLKAKDGAVAHLAQAQLSAITAAANAWAAETGGDMSGFAADLQANSPSIAVVAATLTDTHAAVVAGNGQCLSVNLPDGPPTNGPC